MVSTRLLPISDRNLILTGYTGPYQPLIGSKVARLMEMPFVNIELNIEERSEMSIDEIRTVFGESRLKTIAAEVVQETALRRSAVIRISGQTLMQTNHYERFLETGPVICLVASLDAVLHSLHLSLGARYHNPDERGLALGYLQREWAVRKLPNIHEIDTTYMSEDEIIEAVIHRWQEVVA